MKVLLIDPPFYRVIGYYNRYFPLGITYLAAVLRNAGCQVAVLDGDCNCGSETDIDYSRLPEKYPEYIEALARPAHPVWGQVREVLRRFGPDLVGITVMTPKVASAFRVASLCREYNPACVVVMGGPHATLKPDEMLQECEDIDLLVRGEGEATIVRLIERIKGHIGRCSLDDLLEDVQGVSYRRNGSIIHNPSGRFIDDLDMVPNPARDLLMGLDSYTSEDLGLLMSSRGCPYECSYCATSIWRRNTRYRCVDNVIEEIKYVIRKYNTRQFTFKDDSFTINRNRVLQLCTRLISENIRINWDCNTRVNLIDEELLRMMSKAGCNSIKIGVESGSERILKKMNKGITHSQIRRAAQLLGKSGIFWTGYFMMGVPGETSDEIYQTLELMYEIKPDFASISVYEPFPGTAMFDEGVKSGLVRPSMTLQDFYTTCPNHYYKADPKVQVETISPQEFIDLARDVKEKFHIYNKNVSRLWRRAKSRVAVYVNQPRTLVSDFNKFLSWR